MFKSLFKWTYEQTELPNDWTNYEKKVFLKITIVAKILFATISVNLALKIITVQTPVIAQVGNLLTRPHLFTSLGRKRIKCRKDRYILKTVQEEQIKL